MTAILISHGGADNGAAADMKRWRREAQGHISSDIQHIGRSWEREAVQAPHPRGGLTNGKQHGLGLDDTARAYRPGHGDRRQ